MDPYQNAWVGDSQLRRWSIRRVVAIAVLFAASVVTTVTMGVGMVVVLGQYGSAADWQHWSNIGQAFGVLSFFVSGLALVVLVVTPREQRKAFDAHREDTPFSYGRGVSPSVISMSALRSAFTC